MSEKIFAQALLLCGSLDSRQEALLRMLCECAAASLTARLRDGIRPADCASEFVAAASLYALAAMSESDDAAQIESFTAGDVTVRRSGGTGARCLRNQAALTIAPYVRDSFAFLGV